MESAGQSYPTPPRGSSAPAIAFAAVFKIFLARGNSSLLSTSLAGAGPRLADLSRYGLTLAAFARKFADLGAGWYHPILPLIALAVALRFDRDRRRDAAFCGAIAGILLIGYFGVYILTNNDLSWQVQTSLNRIPGCKSGLCWFCAGSLHCGRRNVRCPSSRRCGRPRRVAGANSMPPSRDREGAGFFFARKKSAGQPTCPSAPRFTLRALRRCGWCHNLPAVPAFSGLLLVGYFGVYILTNNDLSCQVQTGAGLAGAGFVGSLHCGRRNVRCPSSQVRAARRVARANSMPPSRDREGAGFFFARKVGWTADLPVSPTVYATSTSPVWLVS